MSVVYVVLPLAFLVAAAAVAAFVWAVRSGQFDDVDTPAWRVLHDEPDPASPEPRAEDSDSQDPSSSAPS